MLLEKEVIFKEDLVSIFGKRQWDAPVVEETPKVEDAAVVEENTPIADSTDQNEKIDNGTNTESSSKMEKPLDDTNKEV